MKHVDLHCHLAWDLDDGISTLEDCQKFLLAAQKDNIEKIVATPHFICGKHTSNDIDLFQKRIDELKALAKSHDIEIYQGSELYINDLLFTQLQNDTIIPIENTSYVLCEFNVRKAYDEDYEMMSDYLYELILAGYIPILAHIERYFNKRIDINAIQDLVDMGCLIQANTSSILVPRNKTMQKNIFELLDKNLIHVISTDSHDYRGRRSPNMSDTFLFLSKFYDQTNLELLFYQNPVSIIAGEPVCQTQFKKHKHSIWRFFK